MIQRDEVDVEKVTMSYTKVYGEFRNSIRTPERILQAQSLRVGKQNVPLLRKQRRLLEQLVSRKQWTLKEVYETCSHLFRHESGLVRARTQLCKKAFLLRVGRACYHVTDKGRKVAAEPYRPLQKLASILNTSRSTVARMLNPPNLRHSMQVEVPVNVDLMRLVGYYLAEGSVANTTQNGKEGYYNVVELSFGLREDRGEQDLAEDACRAAQSLGFGALVSIKQGYWHVVIYSRHLAHWLTEEFGSGARNKGIPSTLPLVKLRPLLEAYLAGDGYVRGYQHTGTTASLQLAYGIAQLANRIGWRASIARSMQDVNPFKKRTPGMNYPRKLHAMYHVTCYENTGRDVFSDGEYLYLPVRSITHEEYTGTVHNLAVADDESYCVGYHVVHNCRRYGASRRLNPNLDLSLLSRSSRMILAHPHVLNTAWQEQRPPQSCKKEVPGHDAANAASEDEVGDASNETGEESINRPLQHLIGTSSESLLPVLSPVPPQTGPCLFKLWELIPREAAQTMIDILDSEVGELPPGAELMPFCLREIGSTIYQYRARQESRRMALYRESSPCCQSLDSRLSATRMARSTNEPGRRFWPG